MEIHKPGSAPHKCQISTATPARQGAHCLATDRIGYYFNDPYLRNLEAGSPTDLSRETVAEMNNL
jgi:hypothetical protein